MKKVILPALTIIFLWTSCTTQKEDKSLTISLRNTSSTALTDKPIKLSRDKLKAEDMVGFPILLNIEGDTIPSQPDDVDGDDLWDELFFTIDFAANESKVLTLAWSPTEPEYAARTSVRFGKRDMSKGPVYPKVSDTIYAHQIHAKLGYQPYQTDGPSFENDKVGFRHYFDGRNSKDLFGKKTAKMSPEDVGINEEGTVADTYHVMADWGRDVLSVGNSVGIGGFALMIGDSLYRPGAISGDTITNVDHSVFEIIEEGPVRSIMNFTHHNWHPVDDRNYTAEEQVQIWPGMYAFNSTVKISGTKGDETLLIGLVNSNTDQPVTELMDNEKYVVLFTHDKQTYDKTWWLGLAIILPKDQYQGYGRTPETGQFATSYYAKMAIKEGSPVSYYAMGTWELSDTGFTDSTYFVNFTKDFVNQLAADVEVEIKN